ncbi:MAG: energy coupling factor transporter S component ThiW, partial [Rhabdochlamydiaceae bacterium]
MLASGTNDNGDANNKKIRGKQPQQRASSLKQRRSNTVSITVSALLVALGVMTSYLQGIFVIPVGPTKVFPIESMINVIAGVMVGPWYAVATAFSISTIRVGLGLGSPFAYPGSIPGALLVGLLFRYVWKNPAVGFVEILGTGIIGAALSSLIVAPLLGKSLSLTFFIAAFIPPSIIGSILGYIILIAIKATVRKRIGLQ